MVDLVRSEEKLQKLAVQPSFKQFKIFDENLVAVERAKVELMLNQPIYVGSAVLDLSKTLLYNFHYNCVKKKVFRLKAAIYRYRFPDISNWNG